MYITDQEIRDNGYVFKDCKLWQDGKPIYIVKSAEAHGLNVEPIGD
jgi:hypothetical protein